MPLDKYQLCILAMLLIRHLFSVDRQMYLCEYFMHEQSINHISRKRTVDVMQSHSLCRTHFSQYQASSTVLGWLGDGNCYQKCSQVANLIKHSHMCVLASPKALPKNQERGLVILANFLVCAYYVTISCLTWSHDSQLLLMIALQSRGTDLTTDRLQTNLMRQE